MADFTPGTVDRIGFDHTGVTAYSNVGPLDYKVTFVYRSKAVYVKSKPHSSSYDIGEYTLQSSYTAAPKGSYYGRNRVPCVAAVWTAPKGQTVPTHITVPDTPITVSGGGGDKPNKTIGTVKDVPKPQAGETPCTPSPGAPSPDPGYTIVGGGFNSYGCGFISVRNDSTGAVTNYDCPNNDTSQAKYANAKARAAPMPASVANGLTPGGGPATGQKAIDSARKAGEAASEGESSGESGTSGEGGGSEGGGEGGGE